MRRTLAALAIATMTLSCGWAQTAAPNAPAKPAATQPAKLKLTPEQQKIADAYNQIKPDEATVKLDMNPGVEGKPNENFGKPDKGFLGRHEGFLKRKAQPMGLLFIGDSITDGWNGRNGKDIFAAEYGNKYQAANFGIGGDRTQHVLWRIENGELDGIKPNPKVVVIMIGTNNSYIPSSEAIASGVTAIVKKVQEKLPDSKVLLLGIFPRSEFAKEKDGKPSVIRTRLQGVNEIIKKLDDGKKVRYLEIWDQFLTADGTLSKEIMPDFLHPNAKGYQIWADSMRPTLEEMMK